MLDSTTGEVVSMTLKHEGHKVREFYSALPRPVRVDMEPAGQQAIASLPLAPHAAYRRSEWQAM
jgi:hypothetical protein